MRDETWQRIQAQRAQKQAEQSDQTDRPDQADAAIPDVDLTQGKGGKAAAEAILDALARPAGSAMHAVLTRAVLPRNIGAKADMAKYVLSELLKRDADALADGAKEQNAKVYLVDPRKAAEVLRKRFANGGNE
jgi:hypothetical protein